MTPRPPLIAWSNLPAVVGLVTLQSTIYMTMNRAPLRPSVPVPANAVDAHVPFLVWTVWPYLALIAMPAPLALLIRDRSGFRRTIAAYAVAMGLTFLTYAAIPTHTPRPLPPTDDSLSSRAYRALVAVDSPECAFPSGHIVVPLVLSWGIWRDGHPWRFATLAAVLLAAPSIVTTGQHRTWDLVGGAAVAAIGVCAAEAIRVRPLQMRSQRR